MSDEPIDAGAGVKRWTIRYSKGLSQATVRDEEGLWVGIYDHLDAITELKRQRDAAIRGWHRDLVRANLFADEATDEISQAIGMDHDEVAKIVEARK